MSNYQKAILSLLQQRGEGKTICPSEVLSPSDKQDKEMMEEVRAEAKELARKGIIEICQSGEAIDPDNIKGPIRLRLK